MSNLKKKKISAKGCSSFCLSPNFIIGKIVVGQILRLCEQSLGPPGLSLYISNELPADELYPKVKMEVKMEAFFHFPQCYFSALEFLGCLFISWCK